MDSRTKSAFKSLKKTEVGIFLVKNAKSCASSRLASQELFIKQRIISLGVMLDSNFNLEEQISSVVKM